MDKLFSWIANNSRLRKASPAFLRRLGRKIIPSHRYNPHQWAQENPYVGTENEKTYSGSSKHKLGILADLSVSYDVIDITSDDWIEVIKNSDCSAFLVWPFLWNTVWKSMWDDRLNTISRELNVLISPSQKELWLYESKSRTRDWLISHDLPHPKTWVFYSEKNAVDFAINSEYPLVFKADMGSCSHGVTILRDRKSALSLIRSIFSSGYLVPRGDKRDKMWGKILFQEYLPNLKEWRMIRIGDSFLCIQKIIKGDFHSGSGNQIWVDPPKFLLNEMRRITDMAGFTSMNIDFFETEDGRFLINEFHTVFGVLHTEKGEAGDDELNGRYFIDSNGDWKFERGNFYRNRCANLRVEQLLKSLESDH